MGEYKQKIDTLVDKLQDVYNELDKQKGHIMEYIYTLKNIRDGVEKLEEKQS